MLPSSRFALSLKPNVPYLALNLCAPWKKQTTLPSLAYAGIPYQSLAESPGALALMMAWSRSPMVRSGAGIAAIFASTALSSSAVPERAAAFRSSACSRIASRSSSVNTLDALPIAVVLLADFCVAFFVGFFSAIVSTLPRREHLRMSVVDRASRRDFDLNNSDTPMSALAFNDNITYSAAKSGAALVDHQECDISISTVPD